MVADMCAFVYLKLLEVAFSSIYIRSPDGPRTVPGRSPDGPGRSRTVPDGARTVPGRCPDGARTVPGWCPDGARTVPGRYLCGASWFVRAVDCAFRS